MIAYTKDTYLTDKRSITAGHCIREEINSLARAIFFDKNGELRERAPLKDFIYCFSLSH